MDGVSTINSSEIQSGDLLVWRKDDLSLFSNAVMRLVKFLTNASWGHVGIAWRVHDGLKTNLFVIEATIPRIKVRMIHPREEFFCVKTGINWSEKGRDFLLNTVGLRYSLADAVRALLGITLDENNYRWQCVELAYDYYVEQCGLAIPKQYQPGHFVQNLTELTSNPIQKVIYVE